MNLEEALQRIDDLERDNHNTYLGFVALQEENMKLHKLCEASFRNSTAHHKRLMAIKRLYKEATGKEPLIQPEMLKDAWYSAYIRNNANILEEGDPQDVPL